jgi:ribonuclease-3
MRSSRALVRTISDASRRRSVATAGQPGAPGQPAPAGAGALLGRLSALGEGEQKSGGQRRPSILADALEALFGAVWLDAGFDAPAKSSSPVPRHARSTDSRTGDQGRQDALAGVPAGRRLALPQYALAIPRARRMRSSSRVACVIEHCDPHRGPRGTRRAAEQVAAERALEEPWPSDE